MGLNWKGILWFLGITFGLTYAVDLGVIAAGVRFDETTTSTYYGQLIVLASMWFPAIAAFITAKLIVKEDADRFGLRFGKLKPYLVWMALMPVIFAVIYGVTWVLGGAQPDFQMTHFLTFMEEEAQADLSAVPPANVLVLIMFFASAVTIPFLNLLAALGEEIGWRGYLLPRLMPLGKRAAYAISGVIWALWHAPLILIGFTYPGYPLPGLVAFILLVSALNVIVNEMYLRYHRSAILAAWVHGLFNAQKTGIWPLIFVGIHPLIGGYQGLIGILVFWVVGLIVLRVYAASPAPASYVVSGPAKPAGV